MKLLPTKARKNKSFFFSDRSVSWILRKCRNAAIIKSVARLHLARKTRGRFDARWFSRTEQVYPSNPLRNKNLVLCSPRVPAITLYQAEFDKSSASGRWHEMCEHVQIYSIAAILLTHAAVHGTDAWLGVTERFVKTDSMRTCNRAREKAENSCLYTLEKNFDAIPFHRMQANIELIIIILN